ncbi:MAG TPA: tripartite tricarboxylate transporter substrate binding protein [Burkholderiales bacterium]|nr:tripartite tricarboxylate transporter substrate binding protein [Burkholderiales bacterium]
MQNPRIDVAKPSRHFYILEEKAMNEGSSAVRMILRATSMAVLLAAAGLAQAQNHYPSRPIKIIVPLPAGGTADTVPRLIAEKLAVKWGQPVVVENRSGAANNIGADAVARAEPDGYTLLAAPPAALVINQFLYPKLPFDPSAFVPVTVIAATPNILVVHPKVPVSTIQELIGYARSNPNKLNYASPGSGSTPHLTVEWLKFQAGIQIVHVPYKGLAPALTDLLAGEVDMMFDNLGNTLPHIKGGRLKVLSVGSEKRVSALPDVPTMTELYPGFISIAWFAVVAPPKTPSEIAVKLSAAISEALRLPDVVKKLQDLSAVPVGGTPAETTLFMKEETERWRKVIQAARVKPE